MSNREWVKVATIKLWKNDDGGKAMASNASFRPFKDGMNQDITLHGDVKYYARLYQNEDDTYSVALTVPADALPQATNEGGFDMKEDMAKTDKEIMDEIPF
jgi:hypothetical protein|tara:strand:+ start:917 stop:1219 length:303 start_codon:yes stop_codon:yes gene_type:complete